MGWVLLALYFGVGAGLSYAGGRVWGTDYTDSPGPLFMLVAWPIALPFLLASFGRQRREAELKMLREAEEEAKQIDKLLVQEGALPPSSLPPPKPRRKRKEAG